MKSKLFLGASLWIFLFIFFGCATNIPNIRDDNGGFASVNRQQLTGLRIMDVMSGTVEIIKVGENWQFPENGFPVDPDKINLALEQIFDLFSQPRLSVGMKKDLKAVEYYGLDLEHAKNVDLIFGNREIKLRVGLCGENFETTYWSVDGEPNIYKAINNRVWGISALPTFWKSRAVMHNFGFGNDLKELIVSWKDSAQNTHSYRLLRVGLDSAVVVDRDTLGVPRLKAVELIGHARQFIADDFLQSEEEKKVLSIQHEFTPSISVEIVLENGNRLSTQAIEGDTDHYYALNPSKHWVKVFKWRFKHLFVSKSSLISGIPFGPEMADGTEDYKTPVGFGVFMPHFKDSNRDSSNSSHKHMNDHDHYEHIHGH